MPKVNILLSTYNGERYLSEQLESIIDQTYTNWQLLIREDGSKDKTLSIIETYCGRHPNIRLINKNKIKNIGAHRSYYELVKAEKADFYFFCGQDDVWLPDKLENLLNVAREIEQTKPTLYYTAFDSIDAAGEVISAGVGTDRKAQTLTENLVKNEVIGCTVLINQALAESWNFYPIGAEDSYLALLALAIGRLVYVPQVTMRYRQHAANTVGMQQTKLHAVVAGFWNFAQTSMTRAGAIADGYSEHLSAAAKQTLQDFGTLSSQPFFKRLKRICRYRYTRHSPSQNAALWFFLLTNFGRPAETAEIKEL